MGGNAVHSLHVGDTQAEHATEFLQPAPVHGALFRRRGRATIFMLPVLAPYDELYVELDREPYRCSEDCDMFGPGNVADLGQAATVHLAPHDRIGAHFQIVDAKPFDVLDIAPPDVRQRVGRGSNAKWVEIQLKQANDLIGAVLAATDRYDAVIVPAIGATITGGQHFKLGTARVPIDDRARFKATASAAYAFVVEEQIRLGVRGTGSVCRVESYL